MTGNVFDCLIGRKNFLGLCIWDLNSKLLLKGHDHLNCVQAVQAQVSLEIYSWIDLQVNIVNSMRTLAIQLEFDDQEILELQPNSVENSPCFRRPSRSA